MPTSKMATATGLTFYPENQTEQQYGTIAALLLSLIGLLHHPVAQLIGALLFVVGILCATQLLTRHPRLVLQGNLLKVDSLPIPLSPWGSATVDLSAVGPGHVVQRQVGRWPGRRTYTYLLFRPIEDQQAMDIAGDARPPDFLDRTHAVPLNGFVGNNLAAAASIADVINAWRPETPPVMEEGRARDHLKRVNRRRLVQRGLLALLILLVAGTGLWLSNGR